MSPTNSVKLPPVSEDGDNKEQMEHIIQQREEEAKAQRELEQAMIEAAKPKMAEMEIQTEQQQLPDDQKSDEYVAPASVIDEKVDESKDYEFEAKSEDLDEMFQEIDNAI